MQNDIRVTFQPSGRTVHTLPGTRLLEAAARAGLMLRNPCGGKGTCGKCRVRLTQGTCPPTEGCRNLFSDAEIEDGYRLACQAVLVDDCVMHVPAESLFESESRILVDASGERVVGQPALQKRYVELPEPDLEHPAADAERLLESIGPHQIRLQQLTKLPLQLRETGWQGTAVTCDGQFVAWEAGNTAETAYAVAFDVGTTTLVGALLNTVTGTEVAVAAEMNPQISVGDDVISRISLARESPARIRDMQQSVVDALNDLITRLCRDAGIAREFIYEASVAGNTTMQHLLCGISPAALGEIPFVPAFRSGQHILAEDVGLSIHPHGRLYVFPNIGGFVGGDTVAGILANSLHREDGTRLFIDIGTNGEIVLAHKGSLLATSCAAGPAFEGARIVAGMRAAEGAVEKVVLQDGDILCNVIGGGKAAGICGTALIDAVAVMLDLGILDETGRILSADDAPGELAPGIRDRLIGEEGEVRFVLLPAEACRSSEAICIHQRDIRELQLASGAIRAGVTLILRQSGIAPSDVSEVLLAGGFGNYIRRENACRIGLLPDLPVESIRFVGNAASLGAKAVLFSRQHRDEAETIVQTTKHVDLSLDPEFQMEFGLAMMFPGEALAGMTI